MPPLLLDEADVVAITASLLTSQTGSIAGMEENAERALAKLEQVMPPALRRRADALRDAVVQVRADAPPPSIDPGRARPDLGRVPRPRDPPLRLPHP